jgi:hypothetical protein
LEWDSQRNEPERIEKAFVALKVLLRDFKFFTRFKMKFEKESCLFGSNPFADSKIETPFLDQHLTITDKEEEFWRKLILDLCIEKL